MVYIFRINSTDAGDDGNNKYHIISFQPTRRIFLMAAAQ